MYHFKPKDSEINYYALRLRNISKEFKINNMKKTGLKRSVKSFSVDFTAIDTSYILNIQIFEIIKNIFIVLLSNINGSNH